jgi:hypothetical protein
MGPSSRQSSLLISVEWLKERLKCAHVIHCMTEFEKWNTDNAQPLTGLHHVGSQSNP